MRVKLLPTAARQYVINQLLVWCLNITAEQSSITLHCCPLSLPSSAVVLNHISSHFLIPLSDSSFICTVPAQWLVILDTIICIITLHYSTEPRLTPGRTHCNMDIVLFLHVLSSLSMFSDSIYVLFSFSVFSDSYLSLSVLSLCVLCSLSLLVRER